jgi:hypothetical protein
MTVRTGRQAVPDAPGEGLGAAVDEEGVGKKAANPTLDPIDSHPVFLPTRWPLYPKMSGYPRAVKSTG